MEVHANSVEDVMISGLDFKLPPGASYVTNRRSVTFHPQGSNVYRPEQGTRLIKINLASDDFLDPSTVKIMFELQNDDATAEKQLRLLSGPFSLFRRMRVLSGGTIIEDLDSYNRLHQMFHIMTTSEYKNNTDVESGFLSRWDRYVNPKTGLAEYDRTINLGIPGGSKKKWSHLHH